MAVIFFSNSLAGLARRIACQGWRYSVAGGRVFAPHSHGLSPKKSQTPTAVDTTPFGRIQPIGGSLVLNDMLMIVVNAVAPCRSA